MAATELMADQRCRQHQRGVHPGNLAVEEADQGEVEFPQPAALDPAFEQRQHR
jgi:hypothetical protein